MNMKPLCSISFALLLSLATLSPAQASNPVEVDAGGVVLGQVWKAAPAHLSDLQIGSAPPPGSSRLIVRAELVRRLSEHGADVRGLSLPNSVRIKTRTDQWTPERLENAARDLCESKLRSGMSLKRVTVRSSQLVPQGSVPGTLTLTAIPRRVGEVSVSGTLNLEYDGQIVRRVPVSFLLEVDETGATPLVAQGAVLQLFVEKSSAQISALAEALREGDVGDTVPFRVQATKRVVQGVIVSPHRARVVSR